MTNHGHFLSFASFPPPLTLLEKLNIEKVNINIYPVRDPLLDPVRCLLTSNRIPQESTQNYRTLEHTQSSDSVGTHLVYR